MTMSKFRITITGAWIDEDDYNEGTEDIRKEIIEILSNYPIEGEQIKLEDEYCIKKNDKVIVTVESQTKHFNLLKVNVITKEDLDMFIKDGECTCIDDLDVSKTDFDWDYAQRALVDVDENKVIMWNDNIHSNIDSEIDDFLDGITYAGNTYSLKEVCMLEGDMEKYSG